MANKNKSRVRRSQILKEAKRKGYAGSRSVTKATSEGESVSRLRMGEMGSLAMSQITEDSSKMMEVELRWPNMISTVECMKQDATVSAALDSKY